MKLKFCGAAGTVTGSCYYIEGGGKKFLVDCGMFQCVGVEERNNVDLPFNPREIDFVILTHSHIDHSGMIPKLFRRGFRGDVFMTPPTAAITRVLLMDSAKIQEKNNEGIIYSTEDAIQAINNFRSYNYFEGVNLSSDISFSFVPAGHILGAASICLEVEKIRILFSGDLGRRDQSLIKSFFEYDIPQFDPDYIISESLYGNSMHEDRENSTTKLLDIVNATIARDGNVIVPSFALQRTQELVEMFKFAKMVKEIKKDVQFFLDSPMAISITEIYTQFSEQFNESYRHNDMLVEFGGSKLQDKPKFAFVAENRNRLQFDDLRFVRKLKQSLKVTAKTRNVIIAGSGMADGGRIVHHLYSGLEKGNNSVVFVGFQAEETLGRQLVDGAKSVFINRKEIKVKSEIYYLRGFSAHADQQDLKDWLKSFTSDKLKKVFLVHGEVQVTKEYGEILGKEGYNVEIPTDQQEYIL